MRNYLRRRSGELGVTKSVVDQRMLVLALCSCLWGSPVIAASPSQKPLAKRVDAALCNEPASKLPRNEPAPKLPRLNFPEILQEESVDPFRSEITTAVELLERSYNNNAKSNDRIAALSRAISLAPNYQQAYLRRAQFYRSEQQFDLAQADYDRAFQLQPDDSNLLAGKGLLYGDLQQWEKLIAVYDRLYGVQPAWSMHFHTIQARAYAELQQWPEVIQQYTLAIQMHQPKATGPLSRGYELGLTPQFVTQLEGEMTGWLDQTGQALLYLNRGYAYERQTQTQLANADYTLAFASVKESPLSLQKLYRSRCRLKVWAGNMTGAKSDAKLANEHFAAWQAQLSEAPPLSLPESIIKISLEPPLSVSPRISPPIGDGRRATEQELRDINRRLAMEKNVRLGIPPEYFDPAMQMDRDFAPAYYHRGIWRLQTEQFESVLADFDRAIALNPQFSLAHAARGEALQRLKRSDEAMAALDQALKLDPTLAAARFSQGMLWLERGDAKQAESAFDDVLMIDPESIKALTERSKIRRSRQDIVGSTADDRRVKQVRDRWNLPL
jgi:tetratricopeptide (TPR) repeat protein